ncbi:MAG: DUF2971 domain-containing protein [Bacteroidales bacterium]|nr:DUF2971 domain-containing protein [Bacteroidales bacterium]
MTNQTLRKEFQKILNSVVIPEGLSSSEIQEKIKPVDQFIWTHMPAKLFKYRECSERNIDAFNKDTLYAVTADMFNDPFDTLYSYNQKYIIDSIKFGATREFISGMQQRVNSGQPIPEEIVKFYGDKAVDHFVALIMQITEKEMDSFNIEQKHIDAIISILQIVNFVKTFGITCFSEDIQSVIMWSHYANSHEGFALEYDLRGFPLIKKTNDNLNNDCKQSIYANTYPIIYDSKRFDATTTALFSLCKTLNIDVKNPDTTCFLKSTLHKSYQWSYEKEWRLLVCKDDCDYSAPIPFSVHPKAIYYGNKISQINKKRLHLIAIEKGIKEYDMCIDYYSNRFYMKPKYIRSSKL